MRSRERGRRGLAFFQSGVALLAVCVSGLGVGWPRASGAQSPPAPTEREAERRRLLEQLGLKKRPPVRAPPAGAGSEKRAQDADKEKETAPAAGSEAPSTEKGASEASAEGPREVVFAGAVHQALLGGCRSCHSQSGVAGRGKYVLDGTLEADYTATRGQVNVAQPESSALLRRASGVGHPGGAIFAPGSPEQQRLSSWIRDGAKRGGLSDASAVAALPEPPARADALVTAPVAPVPSAAATAAATAAPETGGAAGRSYAPAVHEALNQACSGCHRLGAAASNSGLVLRGEVGADFASARRWVDLQRPEASLLLSKASGGVVHAGGALFPPESAAYGLLLEWIQAGALGPTDGPAALTAATAEASPAAVALATPAAAPDGSGAPPHGVGLSLPFQFRLNGRFDLSYERRNFDTQPFSAGDNALQSYHHFLFLSRQSAEDPLAFSAEVINLTFWEVSYHLSLPASAGQLWLKAGKLLVPFGPDPLFHQSYGGLVGFDQRVLPPIWAEEGLSARFWRDEGDFSGSVDLYALRGYELKQRDAVLNLQNDFSPLDATQLALGFRLRGSWQALSVFYSGYVNALDFGRVLYLQAADVELWRLRGVPVLEHLAAEVGLLRADVSGAGPGRDYYHFASYLRLRCYLTDLMYLQYRQGLRTFDNRRGVSLDDTRLTREDGSTHNFGLVLRHGPLTFGLYYFFVLEKADELRDDFLRVSGVYEF
ncbi:MAG: hypothetical protein ABI895_05000 [Deltaproteobacteria bacterium]